MKRVLLIATTTGYQIRSFGEAAAALGVTLVFASDRCDRLDDPWWDQAIPVRFHDEAGSTLAVVDSLNGHPPEGVIAVGDRPSVLAAHLARELGLSGNPPDAAERSRNKLATRQAFKTAGLSVPWFESVAISADERALAPRMPYPAVLKPMALAGSRGVMRVDTPDQFLAAFARLRRLLDSTDVRVERDEAHEMAMIESFIPGNEYAVEGLLDKGRFRVLAIFDKPDPLDGPFFEETIYITPSRTPTDIQCRIADSVAAASAALGLYHGPVHAECRIDGGTVYVLEVAARPIGGLCSKALRFEPGAISLEELLLRHALGEDVSGYEREAAASGVMMIPIPQRGLYKGVEGITEALAVQHVTDVRITAKADALVVPLPEGKSYLGFIFARSDDPAAVERSLRLAHGELRFTIEKEIPIA